MNQEEKYETAMMLASGRRASMQAFSDTRPCRICGFAPELKDVIQGLLGTGLAMRPILDLTNKILLLNGEQALSMKTLETHRKSHLPIRMFMQREVIEQRAKAASKDIQNDDGSILTPQAYAEIMMNAGAENLINNPDIVSPMEGLAAAKTLHDFDSKDHSNMDIARMVAQLNSIIIAVRAVCSPSQLSTITRMINADSPQGANDVDVI